MKKLLIKDIDLTSKSVLMRVDFNVPLDENQKVTDDKRIRAALPTINYALDQNARLVLMSHLGRPKGEVIPEMSLRPAAETLEELLGKPVRFVKDCIGPKVESAVKELKDGEVLVLENLRFHKEEKQNSPDFAQQLAQWGDIYVNDAFGSAHRAHASTEGVTKFFDICAAGFLMEKEIDYLDNAVSDPEKPFTAILGGAKIADKIPVIKNIIDRVDNIVIGGGMMFTFLKAQGLEIGNSLLDESSLELVQDMLKQNKEKFILPRDCVISDVFDAKNRTVGTIKTVSVDSIPSGWMGLDIGPKSIEKFAEICRASKTVVWNGPMGVFEIKETANGTLEIAKALAEVTKKGVITIIGGGDSASAVKKAGVASDMSHVSTGGGASLELLQGKALPGVEALTDKS
ncbi:MAG: phosphoglycerate kinase [bacterium]